MSNKRIALVSITENAVMPMTQYIKENEPDYEVVNYLDGNLMGKIRKENGMPEEVDMYTVPEAFKAAQEGNMSECDRIVAEKVMELDVMYDQIVLAQISMSGATKPCNPTHARLITSLSEAVNQLKSELTESDSHQ
ncbi:hypothetical protein [Oribacterium sp. FC2011]|uniref:hypothetical protein n=1 Tax=Oribacterium sp. FC2011 TaxID=1408311 RepID=UPI0004E0FC85|nr:hypothetical protein [Oribacterium sp. FC2011]